MNQAKEKSLHVRCHDLDQLKLKLHCGKKSETILVTGQESL
jgi:hypothetical protein